MQTFSRENLKDYQETEKRQYLTLDLVDRVFGVFDVGRVGGWDPTRLRKYGNGVGEDADESDGRENEGVEDSRGGQEAEPPVYENEDRGEVYVGDGQNDDGYRQREADAPLHCSRNRFRRHRRQNDGVSDWVLLEKCEREFEGWRRLSESRRCRCLSFYLFAPPFLLTKDTLSRI